MKRRLLKSKMFFGIMAMSVIIFILAFSVFFVAFYGKEKNVDYFTDNHFLCKNTEKVKIGTILDSIDTSNYSQIAFWDEFNKYKYVNYSDELFSFLSLDKNNYPEVNDRTDKNIVLVNSKYKSQCFLNDDRYYINLFGNTYEVLDFYETIEGDEYTVCYVNAWSIFARELDCYTYMAVDTTEEKIAKIVEKNIPDTNIIWWDGKSHGVIDITDMYFYIVLLCGIILCVNCIGFANMWIRSYKNELSIRKMIGANAHQIHTFIIKEYLKIYSIASIVGVFVGGIILYIFGNVKKLVHVRAIFGDRLRFDSVILAIGSVLVITLVVVEIRFRFRERNRRK